LLEEKERLEKKVETLETELGEKFKVE